MTAPSLSRHGPEYDGLKEQFEELRREADALEARLWPIREKQREIALAMANMLPDYP